MVVLTLLHLELIIKVITLYIDMPTGLCELGNSSFESLSQITTGFTELTVKANQNVILICLGHSYGLIRVCLLLV